MKGTERAEVFSALAELARRYPHWRVGQLVANVSGWADAEVWDAEDEQLLSAAREHLATMTERYGTTAAPSQPQELPCS
jgi:NADPH-dependent curcumin reductase CurA